MDMTPQALPKPLEIFVRKDNAHFRKELQESSEPQEVEATSPPQALIPSSPGKRKYVELSEDGPKITVRERGSDETTSSEGTTLQGASRSLAAMTLPPQHEHEVLMGIDPAFLKQEPEMRERGSNGGRARLANRPMEGDEDGREKTIDSMDFDMEAAGDGREGRVVEDDRVVGASAAVRSVGLVEE